MGFLGVIPADTMAAFYVPETQTLSLYAKGTVVQATYGFDFRRLQFAGGLKFRLEAWTGPLTGEKQPYEFSQKVHISLFGSPRDVIIVDAGHANGVPVQVRWGGLIEPLSNRTQDSKETPETEEALASPLKTR